MTATEIDDVASRALASIILERTADAVYDGGKNAADALTAMTEDTGLPLEIAAGLLYVTSFLVGAGNIAPEDVYAASLALKPDDDDITETAHVEDVGTLGEDQDAHDVRDAGTEEVAPSASKQNDPAPSAPASFTILSLGDRQGEPCLHCECAAIGLVDDRAVCYFHVDHAGDDGRCPSCGATSDRRAPTGEEE